MGFCFLFVGVLYICMPSTQEQLNELMDYLRDIMATKDDLEVLRKEIYAALAELEAKIKEG